MNRALVKPRVDLVPEKIVSPQRTSRAHRFHGSQLQNIRASVRIVPSVPVSSSATSAVQKKFTCSATTQSAVQNVNGKVIMLRKHVEVKPSVPSHFSITVQNHGAETRNVSRTVGNASITAPPKPETSSASTASIATKRTIAPPIQKTKSGQQKQIVTAGTLKPQMGITQKSSSTEEGAVQTKKPRWTLTNVSAPTCSLNDKTSFSPIGAQQSTNGRSLKRGADGSSRLPVAIGA
ncbi:hypothetical protein Tcan_06071 [Toxocara canis]|uniref:Uncharacterized protein n=1 Tax=Toxocara canis TaxID=6265 RepID=A0A0B2W1Y7_TOXCA|nr:hypothetical protein Tcan_06071 [Toxocara canis]